MSEKWKCSGKKISLPPEGKKGGEFVIEKRPGGVIIATMNGKRHRLFVNESRGNFSTSIGGKLFFGAIEKKEWGSGSQSGGSESDLLSQFPGKIRKILAEVGSVVEEGKPLLMMEAMKMEFSIKAPYTGMIEKWNVESGSQVLPGQKFLEFKKIENKTETKRK